MPKITNQQKKNITTHADSQKTLHKNLAFTATEQYKLLRTNLSFPLQDTDRCAVIGVTSSERGEGKSTTAINLAYVLAEAGNRVALIDGDLRIPSVAKKMRINNTPGLSDYLKGTDTPKISTIPSGLFENWQIIPSGPLPPNPSELLGSKRMETVLELLENDFDYVVVDLPPVNIVSDALAISKYLSGMILVVREEYTEKKELANCVRQLQLANVKVLGYVMNGAKKEKGTYGKKYKKYYQYYYRKDQP